MRTTERNALLIAVVTSMTWGLTGVLVRLLYPIPPLTLTAARLLIALSFVLPILMVLPEIRRACKQVLSHPPAYLLAALLTGYYLLATAAFQMAAVAEVALLLSTPPLFVLIIRRIRGDSATRLEFAGALLAASGVALVLIPKLSVMEEASRHALYGNIIAVCAAAFTATYAYIYNVLAARGRAPDAGAVSLLTFIVGSVALSFAAWLTSGTTGISDLSTNATLLLVGLGVVCTAVPTLGFAFTSKHLPALLTATIALFIPLFASLFAFMILGERLPPTFLVGCIFVLGGVALIIRKS